MSERKINHIIIEDEGAYYFCRNGRYANKKVIWHVTSPWLLAKLPMLNEEVFSLEQNISIEQQLRIGHASIHLAEVLVYKLDYLLKPVSKNYRIGRALTHSIQFKCFTLLYKAMLLTQWYKKYKGKDNLVVVGNKHLQPVTDFNIISGRFDNIFSSIVDASKVSMVENIHYIQRDGQVTMDNLSRKYNMSVQEKILYSLSNISPTSIIKKSLYKVFNYKRNSNQNNFSWLKNTYSNYNHHIVVLKRCQLLDESISYLSKNNIKVYLQNNFLDSIKTKSSGVSERGRSKS